MKATTKEESDGKLSAGRSDESTTDLAVASTTTYQLLPRTILDNFITPIQTDANLLVKSVLLTQAVEVVKTVIDSNKLEHTAKVRAVLQRPGVKTCLLVASGALILYNTLPGPLATLREWRISQKSASVLVTPDIDLYKPFMKFFGKVTAEQGGLRPHVKANTTKDLKRQADYDSWNESNEAVDKSKVVHDAQYAYGVSFTYKEELFWCTEEKDGGVRVWKFDNTTDKIDEMLDEIYAADQDRRYESRIEIYHSTINRGNASWEERKSAKTRSLDSVCLESQQKHALVKGLDKYLHEDAEKWYAKRGLPRRKGYLLHGPPGCGKTSLVKAIAGHYGLKMHILTLSEPGMTDKHLLDLFENLGPGDLVLMEDIDAAGAPVESRDKRDTDSNGKQPSWEDDLEPDDLENGSDDNVEEDTWGKDLPEETWADDWSSHSRATTQCSSKRYNRKDKVKEAKAQQRVTLSGLLNALDGPNSPEGHVVFMTSNHPEKLDAALVRPGRIDETLKLDYTNRQQIRDLFHMFYDPSDDVSDEKDREATIPELAEIFADVVPEGVLTPAEILGHLHRHIISPEDAVRTVNDFLKSQSIEPVTENIEIWSDPRANISSPSQTASQPCKEPKACSQTPDLVLLSNTDDVPASQYAESETTLLDFDNTDLDDAQCSTLSPLNILSPKPVPEEENTEVEKLTVLSPMSKTPQGYFGRWADLLLGGSSENYSW